MNVNGIKATEPQTPEQKKLKKACQEFEAVFAKKLLGEMRKGVKETHFGDSLGGEMYRDMMDDAIAQGMAQRGVLGIADILYRDFAPRLTASIDSAPQGQKGQAKP